MNEQQKKKNDLDVQQLIIDFDITIKLAINTVLAKLRI